MKRLFAGIFVYVVIVAVFSEAATITYVDKMGRSVEIPIPAKRAIFFQTYEILPVLDIWDRVVGIGTFAYDNDLMKAVKPDIKKIPSAGSGTDVNIETCPKAQTRYYYYMGVEA
ncbi:MAG: hypothetical protein N2257_10560 [Thermodesulfovibrionales bacterium]|nr:hypothetical protein [Thermodesulfovibrionales bacterium]